MRTRMRTRTRRIRHFLRADLTLFRDFSRRITQLMYILFHFLRSFFPNYRSLLSNFLSLSSPLPLHLPSKHESFARNHSPNTVNVVSAVSTNSSALFCKMFVFRWNEIQRRERCASSNLDNSNFLKRKNFFLLSIIRN